MAAAVARITAGSPGIWAVCARLLAAGGGAVRGLSSLRKGEAMEREPGGSGAAGSNRDETGGRALVDGALARRGRGGCEYFDGLGV